MTLVPRLPRARFLTAALIFGVAIAGAAVLYFHTFNAFLCKPSARCSPPPIVGVMPGWVLPTALALCLLGVAGAYGVLTGRLRLAAAAVILGVTLGAGAVVYADYSEAWGWCVPGSELRRNGNTFTLPACTPHVTYVRASWIAPTALGLVGLGVAVAAAVLVASRRRKPLAAE